MSDVAKQIAFKVLLEELRQFSGRDAGDGVILLPTIRTLVWISAIRGAEDSTMLSAEIFADHEDLPEPIVFIATGTGENAEDSARIAAQQWMEVVLPVLHAAWANHRTLNVQTEIVEATDEKGRKLRWRTYAGPVRVVAFGRGSVPKPEEASATELIERLKEPIQSQMKSATPFWIDAYAALRDDKGTVVDCRLTNFPWTTVTDELTAYAEELTLGPYAIISHRQFLLFMPASGRQGLHAVPPPKPSIWKRILGR